jgi:hypothetical protein
VTDVLAHRASRAQQQIYFVEQLVPGEPVHNISYECRFAGRLDPAALRAAVADLLGRHESLRTRLEVRDTGLWQVVQAPPDAPPLEYAEVSGVPDPEAAYRELCTRVGTAVFDLGRAPLLRLVHVRLGPAADGLIVVVHHAIADSISAKLVVRDLTVAYESRIAGRAPDWPELPVQYADFTAWQEERAASPSVRQDLDYWRGQLAGLSTVDLTWGAPRPERLTQRGRWLDFTIDAELASALEEFARPEHATAFLGLLAVYAATIGRVFGGADVAVAGPVAGRPLPELTDVIGMFVDQVVLRLDLSGGPTFRELVRSARRVWSEAHDHGSVTFDQIVADVAPERVAGMTPLAQAAINLNPPPLSRPAGAMPEVVDGSLIDTGTVTHDLLLDLTTHPAHYTGTVRYRPDVVDDRAAELVCEVFQRLLRAALSEPDSPMWTLDVLPVDDPAELPALDAAANRVAHDLRDRGAGPDVPVLVALPPDSAELAVAFLGVLMAGAVIVPVDPMAPAAELAAVARRRGARLALTLPTAMVVLPASVEVLAVDADPALGPGPSGGRVHVLDRWGRPVPPGCLGELWIGDPGAQRLRTGALVRLRDGWLEFRAPTAVPAAAAKLAEPADRQGPATPVEEALLEGWRWLLPNREFGVTDDFFDIGGDSILAIHAVGEARRHGLELTVRQILDLRTIRALAGAATVVGQTHRAAPLGITGPTTFRLPATVSEVPAGFTADGELLTADPSQVDDWSLARAVRSICPQGTVGDPPGVLVPQEIMAALAGPAHEAYASTTTDLIVAATFAATGAPAVAVADTRREEPAETGANAVPGVVRVDPEAELIRAVKAALRGPEDDDPSTLGVRLIPLPDNVFATSIGDAGERPLVTMAGARLIATGTGAGGLAERVLAELTRLVRDCLAVEPEYSAADFPDAGLDDSALAGLLAGLDVEAGP